MERTVLSVPLGRWECESEQNPLGLHTLDSDKGGTLPQNKSGQTGLDLTLGHSDPDVLQDKPLNLDSLIKILDYSCGHHVLPMKGDQSTNSPQGAYQSTHLEEITLCEPSSSLRSSETDTEVDLLSHRHAPSCLTLECPGEVDPQGVGEEQVLLVSPEEDRGLLPPSQGGETVLPETGDKGLSLEPMPDLPIASNKTPHGLPENRLPHIYTSTPVEFLEGPVSLLDLEVPDHSNLSIYPTGHVALKRTGAPFDSPTVVIASLTSEHQSEDDSFVLASSPEPSSLSVSRDGDAFVQGDVPGHRCFVENDSKDLMEGQSCSDSQHQGGEAGTLDLRSATDELHDEERSTDSNQLAESDLPVQEEFSSSPPEPGWTSEQTVETISLSKMVTDSMPVVSDENERDEEDASPPLKAVFDALDQDGDGFVRIEEFMEFAAAYGADQVKDLTKFLDPSGLGVISFEDFYRGISAISNGGPEPQLYDAHYSPGDGAVGCPEEYDEQNEVTDSAYLGSESTYSECETFTDEDTGALVPPEMHEDVETDSGIEATLHDPEDGGNRFSLNAELHNHSLVTVIGGEEEQFEDFGESNTSQGLMEGGVEGTKTDSSLLQTPEQVNGSSLLLPPSAGKRLSSKKVARHLLQNSSMTLDTVSDLTRDILELADNDITDKMLLLERRVAELEKESEASGEQHARLRQENLHLVHRANALEEQLKEQELQDDEHLQHEIRRHKEALGKLERERGMELENLQARLQQLDEENSELRSCVPCLRANIERLEEEKRKLQDETEDMTDRLNEEMESRRKMGDKLSHERHQNQKEKECTQELIEDLRKQLEHLQLYKLEAEAKRGRCPSAGLQEYQTRTREAELEQEIKRLKQDNRSLKEQNDELNGQIINLSIQGAKNLMSAPFSDSLAAEINSVSRGELMEAIHKQEEINYRLQDYIDKIIVAIMESNPSILEVK